MVPCTWYFQKWTGKAWGVVRKCHERRLYTSGPIRLCASWPLFCSKGSSRGRCSSACSSVFYTGEGCCALCGRPSLTFGTNAPDCDWFKPSAGTLTVNTELLSFGEGERERRKKLHFKYSICLLMSKKENDRQNTLKSPDVCFYETPKDSPQRLSQSCWHVGTLRLRTGVVCALPWRWFSSQQLLRSQPGV